MRLGLSRTAALERAADPSTARVGRREEIPDFREIPLGPRTRQAVDAALAASIWLARHWLVLANCAFLAVLLGAAAAPIAAASGLSWLADPLFASYRLVCHQLPSRSFHILGHPMAFCERDVATYGSMALVGIAFALAGRRWRPLPWRWYLLSLLPMAADGSTQLLGMRESNWELRLLTGAIFGTATVLLAYPNLERFAREVLAEERKNAAT